MISAWQTHPISLARNGADFMDAKSAKLESIVITTYHLVGKSREKSCLKKFRGFQRSGLFGVAIILIFGSNMGESCGIKSTKITAFRIAKSRLQIAMKVYGFSDLCGMACYRGKNSSEGHIMQGNKALNEKRIHPTQKPVALYEWIYRRYAKPGDKILDTHLGSGSSRIAAYDAGLDFVGCEIDPYYFAAQEERFAAHTAQLDMFHEVEAAHDEAE